MGGCFSGLSHNHCLRLCLIPPVSVFLFLVCFFQAADYLTASQAAYGGRDEVDEGQRSYVAGGEGEAVDGDDEELVGEAGEW